VSDTNSSVSDSGLWAIFDGDGFECSSLVGIFDNWGHAENVRARLEVIRRREWTRDDWQGYVILQPVVLNRYYAFEPESPDAPTDL
jgi:hypothetical protein